MIPCFFPLSIRDATKNWLALPVVHLSKLLEKIRTKKRPAKMAREARHFVDEAVLLHFVLILVTLGS